MQLASELEDRFTERLGGTETRTSDAIVEAAHKQERDRRSSQRVLYGGGGSLIGVMALFGGWVMDKVDAWDAQQAAIVQQATEIHALKLQVGILKSQQRTLAREALEREKAIASGFGWLGLKLDAVSTRAKRHPKPERLDELGDRKLDSIFEASINAPGN